MKRKKGENKQIKLFHLTLTLLAYLLAYTVNNISPWEFLVTSQNKTKQKKENLQSISSTFYKQLFR